MTREWGVFKSITAAHREVACISDHLNICRVSVKSELYKRCVEFLKEVSQEAPARIESNTRPCKFSPFQAIITPRYRLGDCSY